MNHTKSKQNNKLDAHSITPESRNKSAIILASVPLVIHFNTCVCVCGLNYIKTESKHSENLLMKFKWDSPPRDEVIIQSKN